MPSASASRAKRAISKRLQVNGSSAVGNGAAARARRQSGRAATGTTARVSCVRYGTGSAATWRRRRRRGSRSSSGSIVAGPRMQFRPTTSAPASAIALHASTTVSPSRVTGRLVHRQRDDRRLPGWP